MIFSWGRRPLIRIGIGAEQFRGRFHRAAQVCVLGQFLGRGRGPGDGLGFRRAEVVDDVAEQVRRGQEAAAIFRIHFASNFPSNLTGVDAEDLAIGGTVVEDIGVLAFGHGPSVEFWEAPIIRQSALPVLACSRYSSVFLGIPRYSSIFNVPPRKQLPVLSLRSHCPRRRSREAFLCSLSFSAPGPPLRHSKMRFR